MTEMTQQDGSAGHEPGAGHGHAPQAEPRCPACGALRPPAVTWCTQCYARFDPPATATATGIDTGIGTGPAQPSPAAPSGPAEQHPDLGPAEPVRPAAAAPVAPEEVEARAQELLARLAGQDAGDGRVRSWSGLVQGNGQRVVAMVVGTVLLTALLFGAMAVVGALL